MRRLTTGCIQGSVLGPRLFSIYVRNLEEYLLHRDARVITYADDSYVILESDNLDELKEKTEACMADHDLFLKSLGMHTNTGKTEAIVFNRKLTEITLKVGNNEVRTGSNIKDLGIIFTHNLHWISEKKGLL